MKYSDKTQITFHHGNGYGPEGVDVEPFAVFTFNQIIDRALIDKLGRIVREYVHKQDQNFCNIKISIEDWDI